MAEDLRTATARQAKGSKRLSAIEATRSRLGQQLDAADREALASASGTEGHDHEVTAAEQAARALEASRLP